jgi:hypothetical protein
MGMNMKKMKKMLLLKQNKLDIYKNSATLSNMKNNNKGYISTETIIGFSISTLTVLILLFLTVAIAGFPGGVYKNFSEGSRSGIVTKLSYKGLIYKSYEAEMNMGGLRKQTDSKNHDSYVANIFEFNVSEQAVKEVQAALDNGESVKLTYHEYLIKPIGIGHSHVVTKVEIVK